jgi:preprotein translocase subunit SecD
MLRTAQSPAPGNLIDLRAVDRRLAQKNLRTALIAGAIALTVFALAFLVGLVY